MRPHPLDGKTGPGWVFPNIGGGIGQVVIKRLQRYFPKKDAHRNFIVGVTSEALWGTAFGLVWPPTNINLAIVALGGSSTLSGLLASLVGAGITFPQAFSALAIPQRFTDPKRMVLIHLPALLGPLITGFGFAFIPEGRNFEKLVLLLAGLAVLFVNIGIVIPYWVGCVGRCIPEKIRGRYFGTCFFASGLCATLTGEIGSRWIDQGGLKWGYSHCFLWAFPFMLLSLLTMLFFKPLVGPPSPPTKSAFLGAFHLMNRMLTEPGPFQIGLILVLLLNLVSASTNLFTVYLKEKGAETTWFSLFTPAMALGAMIGSFCLGWISDHKGHKAAYVVTFLLGLVAIGFIFFQGNLFFPSLAFAASGFLNSAFAVVNLVMILKLAGHKESTVQQGLFNTLMSPWVFSAPLFAGWLAGKAGYHWVFGGSILVCLVALGILSMTNKLDGGLRPKRKEK
jgi:MFS family permease